GGRSHFDRVLPAASAVGHAGSDLWIHLLASSEPGIAVVNPRQRAPHRYSRRFGPLPPCFSRAMLVPASDGRKLLMVGGTASIRGEESMHVGNLAAQLDETTENLRAVATEAFAASAQSVLDCYTDLRIYHPRALDRAEITRHISSSFRSVRRVEWLQGDLCRSDLLVEIEALGIIPALT
ncbi:MAG TPA: hypothetical protein VN541_16055, partial [Tepidisphaeraceae bacterium]|nr:hypothetical protein [Tepidisphaeraceae bacterium]